MKWALLILPFLLFASEPQNTVTLNGVVVEQGTTRPVKEATVQILTLELPYRSTTDAQGRFLLALPADVKRVRIRVTKDGYVPREDWIDVVSEFLVRLSNWRELQNSSRNRHHLHRRNLHRWKVDYFHPMSPLQRITAVTSSKGTAFSS
jgi:hypothetical protein